MPTVTTRPTIKVRVPVKFPAQITVQSPLVLTKTGAVYDISLNTVALLGGGVFVWQVKCALKNAGHFYIVEATLAVDPGSPVYEAWSAAGGIKTSYGDDFSDMIVNAIGTAATQAAYAAATAITL
jgi:hypothetical protein